MPQESGPTTTIDSDGLPSAWEAVLDELRQWRKHGHWWEPESMDQLDDLTVPGVTRQDWERSLGALAKVIFGGLKVEPIQDALTEDAIPFEPAENPLSLLRKVVESREADGTVEKLPGLGIALTLRPESEKGTLLDADALWEEARAFESPAAHFEAVATQVGLEMRAIFRSLDHRYRYHMAKYGYITRSPGEALANPLPGNLPAELSR